MRLVGFGWKEELQSNRKVRAEFSSVGWEEVAFSPTSPSFIKAVGPRLQPQGPQARSLSEAIPKGIHPMLSALCFFCCLKAERRSSNLKALWAAPRAKRSPEAKKIGSESSI